MQNFLTACLWLAEGMQADAASQLERQVYMAEQYVKQVILSNLFLGLAPAQPSQ